MDVVTTSLEALIQRATNPSLNQPEAAAVEAFCSVMGNSPDGVQIATRALAARIQSQNASEALLALSMLDKCMKRTDPTFLAEVGKFRFLNEMIKLVSPKYYGNRTVPAVRQRVLQLLYMWTLEYPGESKMRDAYDMLKKQGVVKETPSLPPSEVQQNATSIVRTKSATFEDEEKSKLLQKLLQSKNPDDLQAANRLIKSMVKEEERRSSTALQEARAAREGARLLCDVVGAWESAGGCKAPDQHKQLAADLRETCKRLRAPLVTAARANLPSDILGEILDANDELANAFQKYDVVFKTVPLENRRSADSLVKFDQSRSDTDNPGMPSATAVKVDPPKVVSPLDDLGEIFSSLGAAPCSNDVSVLKPMPFGTSLSNCTNGMNISSEKPVISRRSSDGLASLDALGKDLLKQSLAESKLEDSLKKQDRKVPMNAMDLKAKSAVSNSASQSDILDLDFLINRNSPVLTEPGNCPSDDVMVDLNMDDSILKSDTSEESPAVYEKSEVTNGTFSRKNSVDSEQKIDIRETTGKGDGNSSGSLSLAEIYLSLECVQPCGVTPLTVFEEEKGLTVVLHFVKDKPREDVSVYVVSTTSRNSQPIEEYKFHTVVPKGYKSRLLEPSDTRFPGFRPFVPPAAITQLLLISSPSGVAAFNMHFLIMYTINGDAISEMGHVDRLPLVGD